MKWPVQYQRYFYLDAVQEVTEDEIRLSLTNFKGDGYLLIRINGRIPVDTASLHQRRGTDGYGRRAAVFNQSR